MRECGAGATPAQTSFLHERPRVLSSTLTIESHEYRFSASTQIRTAHSPFRKPALLRSDAGGRAAPDHGGALATRPTTTVMLSSPPRLLASSTSVAGSRRYQVIATIRSSSPCSTWLVMPSEQSRKQSPAETGTLLVSAS